MNPMIDTMTVGDEEWEDAAVAQLASDIASYPGGQKGFVLEHGERLGLSQNALNRNLTGHTKITYRTYTRAVHLLGYTLEEYDHRVMGRVEAERRRRDG